MEEAVNSARRRLLGLEDRIPWNAVKKSWASTQQKWKNIVTSALDFNALAQELLVLESMLTSNSMAPEWQAHKAAWIMRVKQCAGPAVLEQLVGVLENTIQWHRILVAPDGRPLSAEELASGQFGVGGFPPTPLPPPLSLTLTARANGGAGSRGAASPSTVPDPPDGVPRAAARMQMLLLAMGAKDYDPKVVVQLLDVMHVWTASVLIDASQHARMRVLGSDSATRQHTLQLAMAAEPPIEEVDVVLAVRGRAEHQWTSAAARDVIAQQAADINTEPMPILPRQPVVTLPTDLSQCLPCARSGTPTLTPIPEPVPTLSLEPCQAVPAAMLCCPPRPWTARPLSSHSMHIHTLLVLTHHTVAVCSPPAFTFTGALALCYDVDSRSRRRMSRRRRAGR